MLLIPLVSIITPAYNAAATIAATIRSVQEQNFKDWEMIVVDDSSDDGTGAIVEHFAADDNRIRLIRRAENGGVAKARNQGLVAAQGRFIAFLDADDLWLFEKLAQQLEFMNTMNAAISYTAYRRFVDGGKPKKLIRGPARVTFDTLLRRTPIGMLTTMIDRSKTGEFQFLETVEGHEDLALWLQLTKSGHDILFLNMDLARYRITPGSRSSLWLRNAWWTFSIYRDVAGLNNKQAFVSLMSYGFFAVLKRIL
jgi:teichuronic acid biosynthesis glycosyltransferase TuaG